MAFSFESKLERGAAVGGWTFAEVPPDVIARGAFRPRQRVKGRLDGAPFESALIPRGRGSLFVVVNGAVRERIGKEAGDPVRFRLELDRRPTSLPVPPDLRRAFSGEARARADFDRLAPSHRKAYLRWITEAKRPETRARRLGRAVEMLRRGETLS